MRIAGLPQQHTDERDAYERRYLEWHQQEEARERRLLEQAAFLAAWSEANAEQIRRARARSIARRRAAR